MKKALALLLLGGIGAAAFLLWRRSQLQAAPDQDLWAPVETWPATGADRWPTSPATVVDPGASDGAAQVPDETADVPKRVPRKRAGS